MSILSIFNNKHPYEGRVDPTAKPDPNCAACKESWPIHISEGKRVHIDIIGCNPDYGMLADCPTPTWGCDDDGIQD